MQFNGSVLKSAFKQVYGSGWAFGEADANDVLNTSVGFDWDTWQAGNETAAALVDAPRGLRTMLDKRGIVLKGIEDTSIERIGSSLAMSLSEGLGAEDTANAIDYVIDDPARAMVIARTETTRALVESNLSSYKDGGITEVTWVVADPINCVCVDLDGMTAPIGEEFADGITQPPAHPNCVCTLSPVSKYDTEVTPMDDYYSDREPIDLAANPDAVKYIDSQPRDEHGRWGSSGGMLPLDTVPEHLTAANQTMRDLISPDFRGNRFEILYNVLDEQIPRSSSFTKEWARSFDAVEEFRDDATRALADGDPIGNVTLAGLELVNASPLTTEDAYRGATFSDEELAQFKQGETINLPFASFTSNRFTAEQYTADKPDWERNNPTLFVLQSGAKAIPEAHLADAVWQEIVTSGSFEIVSVAKEALGTYLQPEPRSTDEATVITLKQIGTFDTSGLVTQ